MREIPTITVKYRSCFYFFSSAIFSDFIVQLIQRKVNCLICWKTSLLLSLVYTRAYESLY